MKFTRSRKLLPVGARYGRLVVIRNRMQTRYGHLETFAICRCDCGTVTRKLASNVRLGHVASCGCQRGGARRNVIEMATTVREIVIAHVGRLTPRSPREIFSLVREDYGSVGERRLWRALAWLLGHGFVRRIGNPRATAITYLLGERPKAPLLKIALVEEGLAA